jgi:hypothetical protein
LVCLTTSARIPHGGGNAVFPPNWKPWARPARCGGANDRYQIALKKDFFFNTFQGASEQRVNFGGQRLDRFSRTQFGLFDDADAALPAAAYVRFSSSPWRADRIRSTSSSVRFDVFVDRVGPRPFDRSRWVGITGTGVAVNLRGPRGTLFKADVGKSFCGFMRDRAHSCYKSC